jgi:hypothetical protein
MDIKRFLSRGEASDYLASRGFRVAKPTLAKYAVTGGGPTYRNFGTRVVYDPSDLDEWVKAKLTAPRRSTSEVTAEWTDGEPALCQATQGAHGTVPNRTIMK